MLARSIGSARCSRMAMVTRTAGRRTCLNISPLKASERKYVFLTWKLRADGQKLIMRTVNQTVISDKLHTSTEILKAIKANLKNPDLFNKEEGVFTKVK